MWIQDVKTYLINANILQSTDRPRGRNWLFVKVTTYEGVEGIGEGSGWPEVVEKGVQEVAEALYREEPFHTERIWQKLYRMLHAHGSTGTVRGGVISALDIALWDIKGKQLNAPLHALLGGKIHDRIRIYGHANSIKEARALVEKGYTAFKCGPDVELLKELREEFGYGVDIGVHCHGEFSMAEALSLADDIHPYKPIFLEEPTNPEDLDALRWLGQRCRVPLAAGERLFSKWSFRELLETRAIAIAQPEITRIGGITEMKKIAALCEAFGVMLAPHDGSTGPIAEMANLHVLATTPSLLFLEHRDRDVFWRREVVQGVILDQDGYLPVPDQPGLGLTLDEEAIKKYPASPYSRFRYTYEDQIAINRRTRGTD